MNQGTGGLYSRSPGMRTSQRVSGPSTHLVREFVCGFRFWGAPEVLQKMVWMDVCTLGFFLSWW